MVGMLRRRGWRLVASAALLGSLFFATGASASLTRPAVGNAAALVISGHGLGHGIGLSQWGAEERAAAGQDYTQILDFYYPGTALQAVGEKTIRVLVGQARTARIGSTSAFSLRDAAGHVLSFPSGAYTIDAAGVLGGRHVLLPAVLEPGARPLEVGRTPYRGTLTVEAVDGELNVVNALPLEQYLVGVVSSECPGYWPQEALRAQAVASRSYALANLGRLGGFDVYADDRSQNYHGLRRSFARAAAAVGATRGLALTYDGTVVDAFFSAGNGGLTSVPDGLWPGAQDSPYFVVRPDSFDAASPTASWGPVTLSVARLRAAFGNLPARIADVTVERNGGQRVTAIAFVGTDGSTVSVPGYTFQQRLGLRSTFFSLDLLRATA